MPANRHTRVLCLQTRIKTREDTMSTCRVTLDGIFWRFTSAEVDALQKAEDIALGAAPLMAAAVKVFIADPATVAIAGICITAVAATIAIHKGEFIAANKDQHGVEVKLPNWAIVLGLFGALLMRPLTPAEGAEAEALTQ